MNMKYRHLLTSFIVVCVQIRLPVDMFPANSGDDRIPTNYDITFESSRTLKEMGSIKVNGDYLKHVHNSSTNRNGYVPVIAAGSLDLNMKGHHNVKHVDEFIMGSVHSERSEIRTGSFGSSLEQHNSLNGRVNQVRPIDLHELKGQADVNGLGTDSSSNQIKSVVSLPTRDSIDTKLENIQRRLANLSDNLSETRNVPHKLENGPKLYHKSTALNEKQHENGNKNITDYSFTDLHQQSTEIHKSSQYFDNKTAIRTLTSGQVEGIYWADDLEHLCSKGYSTKEYTDWKVKVENYDVIKMEEGCGSMQNRLVTFNDSSKACVRHRMNSDQMQGDIYSFYLSRLLDIENTPPTTMNMVQKSKQWDRVWDGVIQSKWIANKPVIITQWVGDLESVYMPDELKDHKRGIRPENYGLGTHRPLDDLCNLMQWSDLVLFDYISGNLDRVVNNMFNLKWNNKMLEKPVHNLERHSTSGRLVFLDNESGLFHGYRLLDTYGQYHETLLKSVCVFRKSTVYAIENLARGGNVGERLQKLYEQSEPSHNFLPRMGQKNKTILKQRVQNIVNHFHKCKITYDSNASKRS